MCNLFTKTLVFLLAFQIALFPVCPAGNLRAQVPEDSVGVKVLRSLQYLAPHSDTSFAEFSTALEYIFTNDVYSDAKEFKELPIAKIKNGFLLRDAAQKYFKESQMMVLFDETTRTLMFYNPDDPNGPIHRIVLPSDFMEGNDDLRGLFPTQSERLMNYKVQTFEDRQAVLDRFGAKFSTEKKKICKTGAGITVYPLVYPKPAEADIARGVAYQKEQIGTTAMEQGDRPSTAKDFQMLDDFDPSVRVHMTHEGGGILAEGKGVACTMAGGTSSRMPLLKIPIKIAKAIHGMLKDKWKEPLDMLSKAAVPLLTMDGHVVTFLGLFLKNIARLEEEVKRHVQELGKKFYHNCVLILTNRENTDQVRGECELDNYQGVVGREGEARVDFLVQETGTQYVGTVKDTEKMLATMKDPPPEKIRNRMVERAKEVAKLCREGFPEAVVLPGEKVPLGHGEFLHQMVSSGRLLKYFKNGFKWISVRNIDNAAGIFDENFLIMLKYFEQNGLDFLGEVTPRIDQKGGALIVTKDGRKIFMEQPAFDATWRDYLRDMKKKGYAHVPIDIKSETGRQKAISIAAELFKQCAGKVQLLEYPIAPPGEKEITSLADLIEGLTMISREKETEGQLQLFKDEEGNFHVVHAVSSKEAYGFNPAQAIFSPRYMYYIYRRDEKQTIDEFVQELEQAQKTEQMEAIAARGRARFPTLGDAKSAAQPSAGIKFETNLWQSTLIALGAKLDFIGITSASAIKPDEFVRLPKLLKDLLRFAGTKQWLGPVESWIYNATYFYYKISKVFQGHIVVWDVLENIDAVPALERFPRALDLICKMLKEGAKPTTRDWAKLQGLARSYFSDSNMVLHFDTEAKTVVFQNPETTGGPIVRIVPKEIWSQEKDELYAKLNPSFEVLYKETPGWGMYYYYARSAEAHLYLNADPKTVLAQRLLAPKPLADSYRKPRTLMENLYCWIVQYTVGEGYPERDAAKKLAVFQNLADTTNAYPDPLQPGASPIVEVNEALEKYQKEGIAAYLNGDIVQHLIWSGKPLDLLKKGAKGLFKPGDVLGLDPARTIGDASTMKVVEEIHQTPEYQPRVNLPLEVRQILQYRLELENLASMDGSDPEEALPRQKFVVTVSEENVEQIVEEFQRAKFFGFTPKNIVFVVQSPHPTFDWIDNKWVADAEHKTYYGHGEAMMSLALPTAKAFTVDEAGNRIPLSKAPLQYFQSPIQSRLILNNWNARDLIRVGGERTGVDMHNLDINRAAMAFRIFSEGNDVAVETIENTERREGGNLFEPSIVVESLRLKAGPNKGFNLQKAHHNRMANFHVINSLLENLPREGLPFYLKPVTFPDGQVRMSVVSVEGDITQMRGVLAGAFRLENVQRLTLNTVEELLNAMAQFRSQEGQEGFLKLAESLYGPDIVGAMPRSLTDKIEESTNPLGTQTSL